MPLIDTSFKRVAVDIVRPIAPPSEAGHRYILTLVDYATRYPETVPLKKITTEAVADTTNVKNMYLHRDSNPGPWNTVRRYSIFTVELVYPEMPNLPILS